MSELSPNLVHRLLVATSVTKSDLCGEVIWSVNSKDELHFYLDCSDFFELACADAEPVETETDVALLEQTRQDLLATGYRLWDSWITELYAARRRKQVVRHLGNLDPRVRELFERAGS